MKAMTKRSEDYSQWYLDVIDAADLAEHSDVRGMMVIKPYGYAIWERMQRVLDDKIKETGHENAYFPLLIPKSFLTKEASHVEGFAKECAVVTHYRLKLDPKTNEMIVDPEARLEEELIIRPTSETIIYATFAKWIHSWRDLPLKINQWANVMRWEMRTRFFLRTSEFLWQEGHTAHATSEDAAEEVTKMLEMYRWFAEEMLATAVVAGKKSPSETFAGALYTTTIEAMMQDGKALQAGTSHHLGQNFAKAFDVKFVDANNTEQFVWQTSWGVSTRLIGALIMSHSDDDGLVLPPNIAPYQVVLLPIWKTEDERIQVMRVVNDLREQLTAAGVRVKVDDRENETFGTKTWRWIKKGVPVRIEVGPRDLQKEQVVIARRDSGEKATVPLSEVDAMVAHLLVDIQNALISASRQRLVDRSYRVDAYEQFKQMIDDGGFFYMPWCGSVDCEGQIKEETKATIRCLPFLEQREDGVCVKCGKPSHQRVVFAKAY
jgi:prolyl-tRNA synthetase